MLAPEIRKTLLSRRVNERMTQGARLLGRGEFSAVLARGRVSQVARMVIVALLVAGCGSASGPSAVGEPAALHIVNVDGPRVSILLGDTVVATVPCGTIAVLAPGSGLPGLPWNLTVRADDGQTLGSVSISGSLPQGVLIRGRDVLAGSWPMSYGPAPSPLDTPC